MGQHPALQPVDGVTFTHLLHDLLIGLTGRAVTVTASAHDERLPAMMVCAGTIRCGVDPLGVGPCEYETLFFALEDDDSNGFLLYRETFGGAQWHGDVLHVEQGPLTLMIEPSAAATLHRVWPADPARLLLPPLQPARHKLDASEVQVHDA